MQLAKRNKCHRKKKSRVPFVQRVWEEKSADRWKPELQSVHSVYIHLLGLMFLVIRHGSLLDKFGDLLPPEATKLP